MQESFMVLTLVRNDSQALQFGQMFGLGSGDRHLQTCGQKCFFWQLKEEVSEFKEVASDEGGKGIDAGIRVWNS